METYSRQEAADRAGVSLEEFNRQVEAGILKPDEANRFSAGEVRKAGLIKSLQAAGLPLDGLAEVIRRKHLALNTEQSYCGWLKRYCACLKKLPNQFAERKKARTVSYGPCQPKCRCEHAKSSS